MSSSPFIDKINQFYKTPTATSLPRNTSSTTTMPKESTGTREDERGFQKTENYIMVNPREANFQETGKSFFHWGRVGNGM